MNLRGETNQLLRQRRRETRIGTTVMVHGSTYYVRHSVTKNYSRHKGNQSLNWKTLNSIHKGSGLSPEAHSGRSIP